MINGNKNENDFILTIRNNKILPLIKKINRISAKVDFKLHIWWAKKPNNIISLLIKELSNENEIVLDPFIGSGITLHEALKLNRKCIALDVSKLAIFITRTTNFNYNKSIYLELFNKVLDNLLSKRWGNEKYKITDLYLTKCPICGKKSEILYVVYDNNTPIWLRLNCNHNGKIENIKKKKLDNEDFILIKKINEFNIPYWIPNNEFFRNSRINIKDNIKIESLFTKRNLIILSIINNEISKLKECPEKWLIYLTFSSILRKTSKLIGIKGGLSIGYWIPKKGRKENNPIIQFIKVKNKIIKNWDYFKEIDKVELASNFNELLNNKNALIKNVPIQNLSKNIPNNSIDLVITDPPYGDEVPYLELGSFWGAWLNLLPSNDDLKAEIILSNSPQRPQKNPKTDIGLKNYEKSMEIAFKNISQVLKPYHIACIWFHEIELPIWNIMVNGALKSGLSYIEQTHIITNVRSLKPKFTPYPTLTGHVLSFFVKLPKIERNFISNIKNKPNLKSVERLILDTAIKIIQARNGTATTNELYTNEGLEEGGIISILIKRDLLDFVSKYYKNLFEIFKKELYFDKDNGRWYIQKDRHKSK